MRTQFMLDCGVLFAKFGLVHARIRNSAKALTQNHRVTSEKKRGKVLVKEKKSTKTRHTP